MRSHSIRRSLAALLVATAFAVQAPASAEPPSSLARAEALLAQGDYAGAEKVLLTIQGGTERAAAQLAKARIELLTGRY
ncbi:hypothetical protein BE17_45575, partial [Sorangium cellulosum]